MDYLTVLYLVVLIVFTVFVKVKKDIQIYRVVTLSFFVILTTVISISIIYGIIFIFFASENVSLFNEIKGALYLILYLYFIFVTVLFSVVVNVLQKFSFDVVSSAFIASFFAVLIMYILSKGGFGNIPPIVIFSSYFISVIIEDKIFKGKK